MKINKMTEEKLAPLWSTNDKYDVLSEVDSSRLQKLASVKRQLNDIELTEEMDFIEKCASVKSKYFYNTAWSKDNISQLKEYASINGISNEDFIGIETNMVIAENNGNMVRTASTTSTNKEQSMAEKLNGAWKDPFNFNKNSDTSHMDKKHWQQVTAQDNLKDMPDMDGKSVIAVRGGEQYDKNSIHTVAPGRNSIASPDAIGTLANNNVEDTGARLTRERQERETAKVTAHKKWETDKINAMEHRDIVSKGKVFPTENMTAQSGLNSPSSQMGVYAKFDKNDITEKTAGESLSEKNTERRKSIQRGEKNNEWQKPSHQSMSSVSDTFADSLKKSLNKE